MKMTTSLGVVSYLLAILMLSSCSGVDIKPDEETFPVPPEYVFVTHPGGFGMGDLEALFLDSKVQKPTLEELRECSGDFMKLRGATRSNEEIAIGAREFVRLNPVQHHWCFYSKILDLEQQLKREDFYLEDRQKQVVQAFLYLSPIARAFFSEYQDSRYWRWAIHRYRLLSETFLYRKVDPSPETTLNLVSAAEPMGGLRKVPAPPAERTQGFFILEKYGILSPPSPVATAPTVGSLSGPEGGPTAEAQLSAPSTDAEVFVPAISEGELSADEPEPPLMEDVIPDELPSDVPSEEPKPL